MVKNLLSFTKVGQQYFYANADEHQAAYQFGLDTPCHDTAETDTGPIAQ